MTTVDLVWFNAGGGHRAAADALEQGLALHDHAWRVRRINLFDVLDPQGVFRRFAGFDPEDLYNKRLSTGITVGLAQELKLLQAGIRIGHASLVARLARHWRDTRPDIVVSLIPNFNRAMHDALALGCPGTPFVTVMTDMADHPPSFWIEPGIRQHVVCGTDHAVRQAVAAGVPRGLVHPVHGMMLRPAFHAPFAIDRAAARRAAGLDDRSPVGLVMFGGAGSRVMRSIAASLPETPLVLLCGRNDALAGELRRQSARAPRVVLGYTPDVARWMRLSDFFIGKPGPGALSEATLAGLPVIVTRNAWTLPQERWNATWVEQGGYGLVLRRYADLPGAVRSLLADLPAYRHRVGTIRNRAVFKVPEVLHRIRLQASRRTLRDAGTDKPLAA